jgi:hypothetical protein
MKKNMRLYLTLALFLGFAATLVGSLCKHYYKEAPYEIISMLGYAAFYVFAGLGVYEVQNSTRIGTGERRMWTVFLVVMPTITGLIYLISGREKVVERRKHA